MIEFYWGLPGEGKSFLVTGIAKEHIIKGRMVFSNYPIYFKHKGKMLSSYVWDDKYVYEPIHDCDIIIDEGYRTASSRDWKNFTVDEHTFYGTVGHNGIDVYFITQAIPRIEVIIRELVGKFHHISKTSIPWIKPDPRGFYEKVLWFLDETSLQDNSKPGTPSKEIYTKSHTLFNKTVAAAYDTKYYRSKGQISFIPELWTTKLNIIPDAAVSKIVKGWLKSKLNIKKPE